MTSLERYIEYGFNCMLTQTDINNISDSINKSNTLITKAYRGINVESFNYAVGDIYTSEEAFMSFTLSDKIALDFADGIGVSVVFTINNSNGLDISNINTAEAEILISGGFTITDIDNIDGVIYVTLSPIKNNITNNFKLKEMSQMAYKQCNTEYNYKGFLIRFSEYQQEWNIEPLFITDEQLETIKNEYTLPTARTISSMKKYIRENLETLTDGINEFLAAKEVVTETPEVITTNTDTNINTELIDMYNNMSLVTLKDIADGKGLHYNKNVNKTDLIDIINNDNDNDNMETINDSVEIGTKVKITSSNPITTEKFNQSDISKFIGVICTVTHIGTHTDTHAGIESGDVIVDFIDPTDNRKISMLLNKNEYEVI